MFITPAAKCPGMLLLPKPLTCSCCLHNVDGGMPCVSTMNSCVLLWHVGLPHSFHPLRASQALRGTAASRLNCTGCSIAHICRCRTTQVKMSQTDSYPARRPSRVQQTFVRVLRALALEKKSRLTAPKILLQIWRFDLHIFATNNLQTKRSITWQ